MTAMPLRIFTEPQQGATYGDLLAVAQEAEALGFDAFFRAPHCSCASLLVVTVSKKYALGDIEIRGSCVVQVVL